MPIRNLTEQPRMPRLGKIHLGVRQEGQRGQYPKAVDHFICPPEVVAALAGRVPFCEGTCGVEPGPVELPILFMSNDAEQVANQWFRAYKANLNLVCKGDGYRADALLDRAALTKRRGDVTPPLPAATWASSQSTEVVRAQIDCLGEGYDAHPPCPMYAAAACKRLMMLQFAIPDAPGLGIYQLDTTSRHSIRNVNGFLQYLATLTRGRIAGIPLLLRVQPLDVTVDGRRKTVHVLSLSSRWTVGQLAESLDKPVIEAALPPPDDEIPTDLFPEEAAEEPAEEATGPDFEGFWAALGLGPGERGATIKAAEQRYACRFGELTQQQLDEMRHVLTAPMEEIADRCTAAQSKKIHTLLGKYSPGDPRQELVIRTFGLRTNGDQKAHTAHLSKTEASRVIDMLERMEAE